MGSRSWEDVLGSFRGAPDRIYKYIILIEPNIQGSFNTKEEMSARQSAVDMMDEKCVRSLWHWLILVV